MPVYYNTLYVTQYVIVYTYTTSDGCVNRDTSVFRIIGLLEANTIDLEVNQITASSITYGWNLLNNAGKHQIFSQICNVDSCRNVDTVLIDIIQSTYTLSGLATGDSVSTYVDAVGCDKTITSNVLTLSADSCNADSRLRILTRTRGIHFLVYLI